MTSWKDDLERARAEAQRAREEAKRLRDEARHIAHRLRDEAREQAHFERDAARDARRAAWSARERAHDDPDSGVRVEKPLDLAGVRELHFDQTAGRVALRTCAEGESPAVVTTAANSAPELEIRRDGDRLFVTIRMGTNWLFRRRQGARTSIRVAGSLESIRLNAGYGDIHVDDVTFGTLKLEAGAGQMTCSGTRGNIEANVGAGRIALREHHGTARCNTGTGDVMVDIAETAKGEYVVDSGIGRAELRLPPGQQVEIKASSGLGRARIEYPNAGAGAAIRAKVETGLGEAVVRSREQAESPREAATAPRPSPRGPGARRREAEELRVLQMLEQGKITSQEAAELIAALQGATMPSDGDTEPAGREPGSQQPAS